MTRRMSVKVYRGLLSFRALVFTELEAGDEGAFAGEDWSDANRALEWFDDFMSKLHDKYEHEEGGE